MRRETVIQVAKATAFVGAMEMIFLALMANDSRNWTAYGQSGFYPTFSAIAYELRYLLAVTIPIFGVLAALARKKVRRRRKQSAG